MEILPPPIWEAGLRKRLRESDHAAFESVVKAHYERVYRQLWHVTGGDETLSADLTQETFAAAWGSVAGFDGRSGIGTWLHTIAVRVWYRSVRDKARRVPQSPLASALSDLLPDSGAVDPAGFVALASARETLAAAVNGLPPAYRRAVHLFYTEELRYRDIAAHENIAEGTVKSRLSTAIRLLRARLQHRKEEVL